MRRNKHRIVIALLLSLMLALSACGEEQNSDGRENTEKDTAPKAANAAPTPTPTPEGRVYWLSSNTEANQILQLLAQKYRDETGKQLEIVTVARERYDIELKDALQKGESAPSLIEIRDQKTFREMQDKLYDLKDSAVTKQLTTTMFTMTGRAGEKLAIPCELHCLGLIANLDLLAKCGYTVEEITDYSSLKKVAEKIHQNSSYLGFDAFTSSPINEEYRQKYVAQTANVALYQESADSGRWTETPYSITGNYIENYKNLWDLYSKNTGQKAHTFYQGQFDPLEEFGTGKAVFFQGTDEEYQSLTALYGLYDGQLAFLPLYSESSGGGNLGISCGCSRYWAINKNAGEENIRATEAFLEWVTTSANATDLIANAFGALPYKKVTPPLNAFLARALEDISSGKTIPETVYSFIPNSDSWCAKVAEALHTYNQYGNDQAWAPVKTAFIDGWTNEVIADNR